MIIALNAPATTKQNKIFIFWISLNLKLDIIKKVDANTVTVNNPINESLKLYVSLDEEIPCSKPFIKKEIKTTNENIINETKGFVIFGFLK